MQDIHATLAQLLTLATFAVMLPVLIVSHDLADHVIGQTDHQAARKGAPTPEAVAGGADPHAGWGANLAHVGQYHLAVGAFLALVWAVLPLPLTWTGLAAGLAFSAVTHAFLDRRWPVRRLLRLVRSAGFADLRSNGMNGMYLTDQALHRTALVVSALLITLL